EGSPLAGFGAILYLLCRVGSDLRGKLVNVREVRTLIDIVLLRPSSDFLGNRCLPIARIGVITEKLGGRRSGFRSQCLKEVNHRLWVVASLVKDHGANRVGLRFIMPRVFQRQALGAHLNSHLCQLPNRPSGSAEYARSDSGD